MTPPRAYLLRMVLFLVAVTLVGALLADRLILAFGTNPLLNLLIACIGLFGIVWTLRQVISLGPEVVWLEAFQVSPDRARGLPAPRLLAPMASMLTAQASNRDSESRITLSAAVTRSMLDSLASRLDESRELSRYMTGLLIFLGLLGTFWGLLLTVGAVSDVIASMSVGSGDINALFEQLKSGLAKPLHGMGTAFSSSMFGLSAALVLGFLDLTAGQAQNRFFNELEEWLARLTHVSTGLLNDGEAAVPVYVQLLLEQTAENMQNLQRTLARGEESRQQANQAALALNDQLANLAELLRASQTDQPTRHLQNIEATLQRLAIELNSSQSQNMADLRGDLRLLTRALAVRDSTPR